MNQSSLLRLFLIAVFIGFNNPAVAATVTFGTLATSGGIVNCPPSCDVVENSAGGSGVSSADSEFRLPDPLTGTVVSSANSNLDPLGAFTPSLGVLVDNRGGLAFASTAIAGGIQSFQNTSAVDDLLIDLGIALTVDGPTGLASLGGQVVVYRTDGIEITGDGSDFGLVEIDFGDPNLIDSVVFDAAGADNFQFLIGPGENFLIWAGLQATAFAGGYLDASNTLSITLSVNGNLNDTSSLSIASQNVGVIPLPAGAWLFLTGIGLVAGLSRRRKLLPAS